jgi:hypothetical protein
MSITVNRSWPYLQTIKLHSWHQLTGWSVGDCVVGVPTGALVGCCVFKDSSNIESAESTANGKGAYMRQLTGSFVGGAVGAVVGFFMNE